MELDDEEFVTLYLSMDKYYNAYERTIFTVGDVLSNAGGLYGSVLLIGGLFVSLIANRLFISAILHKIYQIDARRDFEVSVDQIRSMNPIENTNFSNIGDISKI